MKRLMLVTALGAVVVATSCTPVSETSTTSSTPPTTAPVPTTDPIEPPIRTGVGVEDGVIRIGVMVPRTGPVAAFGESVLAGQMAYWTDVNETLGGVGGETMNWSLRVSWTCFRKPVTSNRWLCSIATDDRRRFG